MKNNKNKPSLDEQSTIVETSNLNTINMNMAPSTTKVSSPTTPSIETPIPAGTSEQYIGNKNSKKFHVPTCRTLPSPANRVYFNNRDEAIKQGFTPCGNCKP